MAGSKRNMIKAGEYSNVQRVFRYVLSLYRVSRYLLSLYRVSRYVLSLYRVSRCIISLQSPGVLSLYRVSRCIISLQSPGVLSLYRVSRCIISAVCHQVYHLYTESLSSVSPDVLSPQILILDRWIISVNFIVRSVCVLHDYLSKESLSQRISVIGVGIHYCLGGLWKPPKWLFDFYSNNYEKKCQQWVLRHTWRLVHRTFFRSLFTLIYFDMFLTEFFMFLNFLYWYAVQWYDSIKGRLKMFRPL